MIMIHSSPPRVAFSSFLRMIGAVVCVFVILSLNGAWGDALNPMHGRVWAVGSEMACLELHACLHGAFLAAFM